MLGFPSKFTEIQIDTYSSLRKCFYEFTCVKKQDPQLGMQFSRSRFTGASRTVFQKINDQKMNKLQDYFFIVFSANEIKAFKHNRARKNTTVCAASRGRHCFVELKNQQRISELFCVPTSNSNMSSMDTSKCLLQALFSLKFSYLSFHFFSIFWKFYVFWTQYS